MSDSERVVAETHVEQPPVAETPVPVDPDVSPDGGTQKVPEFKIPETPKEVPGLKPEDFAAFAKEYQETGALSEDTYGKLGKLGIPKEVADSYVEGQMARLERDRAELAKELGGVEVVQKTLEWAAANLSADRIAEINRDLATASKASQATILRGLAAEAGVHKAPALAASSVSSTTDAAYKNESEWLRDARSPKFKTDPEFRARAERRLKHSLSIGTIR